MSAPETSVDPKGRTLTEFMTEREMLEEIVQSMRVVGDALELISKNPMLSAMFPAVRNGR